jgi:hypothetical protein
MEKILAEITLSQRAPPNITTRDSLDGIKLSQRKWREAVITLPQASQEDYVNFPREALSKKPEIHYIFYN